MGSWTNADGLTIFYGPDEALKANGGEYKTYDLLRTEDVEVNLTTLTTVDQVITRNLFPFGKVLGKVEIIADTLATTGTSAALNVGFINLKTNVAIDADGAVAAMPVASINVEGETNVLTAGVTSAGAQVGTVVTALKVPVGITAATTTGTFTAGRIRIRLFWYKKSATT